MAAYTLLATHSSLFGLFFLFYCYFVFFFCVFFFSISANIKVDLFNISDQKSMVRSYAVQIFKISTIALDKMLFQFKNFDIFLISPWKHMLWVLIRSSSAIFLMSIHSTESPNQFAQLGNFREIYFFPSGNCQGFMWCVREKWNFAKKCHSFLHFSLMEARMFGPDLFFLLNS